jgi:hypothetical protein
MFHVNSGQVMIQSVHQNRLLIFHHEPNSPITNPPLIPKMPKQAQQSKEKKNKQPVATSGPLPNDIFL